MTETMNDTNNYTFLHCYQYDEENWVILGNISFWIEGVLPIIIGIPGILGNVLASIILSGRSMRNSFNFLLIALAVYDSAYVILDILQKRSELHSRFYIILFPYFLYPLEMIAMTGSILLTVAIAIERYTAVHYPISYRQTMKNANAMKKRVATYLIPVTIICIGFNVTKFLEMSYVCNDLDKTSRLNVTSINSSNETLRNYTDEYGNDIEYNNSSSFTNEVSDIERKNNTSCDKTTKEPEYEITVTEFRKNPSYAIHFNWFRFISIGVIPFILLVYLNAQVYSDLHKRQVNKGMKKSDLKTPTKKVDKNTALKSLPKDNNQLQVPTTIDVDTRNKKVGTPECNADDIRKCNQENGSVQDLDGELKLNNSQKMHTNQDCVVNENIRREQGAEKIELAPLVKKISKAKSSFIIRAKHKEDRMGSQDRALAFIMMGYVMVFLICHSPRLLLNIYELVTIR